MTYWKILNKEALKEHKVEYLEISNGEAVLIVNLSEIPKQFSVADFLNYLQNEGIVLTYNK